MPKKLFSTLRVSLVIPSLVLAYATSVFSPLSAEESPEKTSYNQQERVVVGKKQKASNGKKKQAKRSRHSKKAQRGVVHKFFGGSFATKHYSPTYTVKSIGAKGKTLVMNDETVWEIAPSSASTIRRWPEFSRIVIKPNSGWFTSYDYCLYNILTREYAEADLSQGPFVKYAIFIKRVDFFNGLIELTDGSVWQADMNQHNMDKFRHWKLNQAILLGENDSWCGQPYILININENAYIVAQCLNAPYGG